MGLAAGRRLNSQARTPALCCPPCAKKSLSPLVLCGIVSTGTMSEFKFACPVCGQHITAHSSTSGGQIECPTCYRKIVVPQAPEAGDSKLILSAAQVAKARPTSNGAASQLGPLGSSARRTSLWALLGLLVLLGVQTFHERASGA